MLLNYAENETVGSPAVVVCGSTPRAARGVVAFTNNANTVFPPQHAEINNGHFKSVVHLAPGANRFEIEVFADAHLSPLGFPQNAERVVDELRLTLHLAVAPSKPVHLCVVVGSDSTGAFDMPSYRRQRGELSQLDTAVYKLKVAARLMQAFTHEEMRANGLGNRTWQFVEETESHQRVFGYTVESPTPHREVKVHVLRLPKTVAQLRDPNLAQQNPHASDSGGLFGHAIDLIKDSELGRHDLAVQCAVLYLDATFDTANRLILAHAALGGGTAEVKLAIFGSHGIHSWPTTFAQCTDHFADATRLSKREVANDCNECGTSWECLNVTLGAFMHEIGHALGCPHQVDGVMLRDYVWLNRLFMTRELECLRTKRGPSVVDSRGQWLGGKVCHWNRLDQLRFLYHDSFTAVADDASFGKIYQTRQRRDPNLPDGPPVSYPTQNGCMIKSSSGIYLVEFVSDGLARHHWEYLPASLGGHGLVHELSIDYDHCLKEFKRHADAKPFEMRFLLLGGDLETGDFKKHCAQQRQVVSGDFGFGRRIEAFKSSVLGRPGDKQMQVAGLGPALIKVRVYHRGPVHGVRFYVAAMQPPPPPPRNFLGKVAHAVSRDPASADSHLIGREIDQYDDFEVPRGERIAKLHFKCGWWIDAVQFETDRGTKSRMFGNANGGGSATLEAPGAGHHIVGVYGYSGDWMDAMGVLYSE